jgi:predicted RNA-binding protein with PUA-like domain
MNYFLAKTDPSTYSIADFEKERVTAWSGVRNPAAVLALKAMRKGDRVFIGEGAIRGLAVVVGNSRPDPQEPRSWLVDFKFVRRYQEPYVNIRDMRASGLFPDFALIRQSRLSVMAVPKIVTAWLQKQGLQL